MIRLFNQHNIRSVDELSGLWQFNKADDSQVYQLAVPGCWEQNPDLATFRGQGWYQRVIEVPRDHANLRLVFQGVSHTADVYFDHKFYTHHYNAYTPFSVVIPNVTAGTHIIRVRVDNRFGPQSALHKPNDYYSYGGLTRAVSVEYVADAFIETIHFASHMAARGWIGEITATVRNISSVPQTVTLGVSVASEHKDWSAQVIAGQSVTKLTWTAPFTAVTAWTPDQPQLYQVCAQLQIDGAIVDDLIERVGFRQVQISGQRIQLNGRAIFLQGFNRHEDSVTYGCALPFQQLVQDLDLMTDLGANAVRTAHYPNDQLFLDLCDERGLLVWEEAHARGLTAEQMQNPNFDQQCADSNQEMITAHFNHPSIIVWGILNECASDTQIGRAKYQLQYQQIRQLDATRPLTSATCQHFKDICLELPDVVSDNLYTGWYEDGDVGVASAREQNWLQTTPAASKPLIISEFGAGAIYGYRNPTRCKWSEERQADILGDCLDVYLNDARLSGAFIWQFCDCRVTEEQWFAVRPRAYNNKGVVDEYRRPKLAYETVRAKLCAHRDELEHNCFLPSNSQN